jgi:D-ribose pyranose/furanose isomerase RbsD
MQGTLVDDRQAFQTGPGRAMFIKRDAPMGMAGIESMPPPQVGGDMMALSAQLKEEMINIPGITEELLGTASDDISGVLSMLRQGAGLTTLRSLFDNVDFGQTLLTRTTQELAQTHWQPSKVRRIIGEEPSPQFKNKAFQKYDAIVINGEFSAEQRQMEFVQLLELQKLGIPIPPKRLIDTLVVQNKDKLLQEIEEIQQQQQKVEQQKMALEMQNMQAQNELVKARALADSGLGVERISRIQENKMLAQERLSESQKNRESATLDAIKSIKEIQDMDLNQFIKAYTIYKNIENDQKLSVEQQSEQIAAAGREDLQTGLQALVQQESKVQPQAF